MMLCGQHIQGVIIQLLITQHKLTQFRHAFVNFVAENLVAKKQAQKSLLKGIFVHSGNLLMFWVHIN